MRFFGRYTPSEKGAICEILPAFIPDSYRDYGGQAVTTLPL